MIPASKSSSLSRDRPSDRSVGGRSDLEERERRTRPHDRPGANDAAGRGASEGPHILIVDDDPEIRLALETYFQMEGYRIDTAEDGVSALEIMKEEPYFDLVLLDVVLPRMNGFEVLQETQSRGYTAPVLMMSGRGDQENILKGYGLGAQDYIVKPFEPEDLFERTEALIGRDGRPLEPVNEYRLGSYVIDFQRSLIRKDTSELPFNEMELDILRCLVRNRGCVVTKKRLLREAWHIDDDLIAHTINPDVAVAKIDPHVGSIRRKIEPNPSKPRYIHTVYGLGYRFTG